MMFFNGTIFHISFLTFSWIIEAHSLHHNVYAIDIPVLCPSCSHTFMYVVDWLQHTIETDDVMLDPVVVSDGD